MTATKHPFSARIIRTGKRVIEVNIWNLTARQWASLCGRLDGKAAVHHISDIEGLLYVVSQRAADAIAKLAGRTGRNGRKIEVECRRGKIDTSGLSYQFEIC